LAQWAASGITEVGPEPELYSGIFAQKATLNKIFVDLKVDSSVMRAISEKMMGTPMTELSDAVKAYIANNNAGEVHV
jgi:hypothetical protein